MCVFVLLTCNDCVVDVHGDQFGFCLFTNYNQTLIGKRVITKNVTRGLNKCISILQIPEFHLKSQVLTTNSMKVSSCSIRKQKTAAFIYFAAK